MLGENPLYDILKNNFQVSITSAEEAIESILLNKVESIYLDTPQEHAGLKIERITFEHMKAIEYTISIARGDKFKYCYLYIL